MNRVIIEYWFYFVMIFINLCIFGTISVKKFKGRNEKRENSVFASKKWYKFIMLLADYGLTIVLAIVFLTYVLDLPYVIGEKYCVKEGVITHVYKTAIDIDGSTYTTITTGLHENAEVRVYYLPFTKNAPIVEIIE